MSSVLNYRGLPLTKTPFARKNFLPNLLCCILTVAFCFIPAYVHAALNINLLAVNASATEAKDYPIKYYLPKELKAPDILNTGGLEVDYDVDVKAYYVSGKIALGPKESKTIKIEVNDVWKVKTDDVQAVKKQLDENLNRLKDTPDYDKGVALKARLEKIMDDILAQQETFSGNVDKRIEQYRMHVDQLQEIRNASLSVDYWENKQGPVEPVKLADKDKGKTVKLIVELENKDPVTKTIKQQHYLPSEIKPEDVVDSKGFEVRYDDKREQSYLYKEESFQAGEKKRYEIEIKDIWSIPDDQIDFMDKRANLAFEEIKSSKYAQPYMMNAQSLMDDIGRHVQAIIESQKEKKSVKKHIGDFRTNQQHFDEANLSAEKLEKILAEVRYKRLEELEKSRVKNVLQKLRALNGVKAISEALFKQKPTASTTWKIIFGAVIFVALVTLANFLTWIQRSKAKGLKELEKKKAEKK